ncbi:trigger factor [Candidatus Palibaumannia cicadellinicola]|uniref:Trigger factor n=1 Tax=Candidatus Palibaumannia cicadellinicola TaxID=186490 RepID=A0A088N1G4_9GAMM|nr:trigger factor [Candidatus Baumannia cicadellinicola]AIN47181.1 Cell division trigger factor [Candidatus Baumannia cicadellinicola]
MQIDFETTEGLKRRVTMTITCDKIEQSVHTKLVNIAQTVCIDGFRKGKAPMHIVTQRYLDCVRQDVLNNLMHHEFITAMLQQKINYIGTPNYLYDAYQAGKDFIYRVEFEVYPEVELKGLDNITVEKPLVEVKDTDVDIMLEKLMKQKASWEETSDAANIEDRVTIDFTGKIENKELEGGKAHDLILTIGQEQIFPGLDQNIIGHKAGESFDINVNFPNNYHTKNLQNKSAIFSIVLKKVEQRSLPKLDETFIKCFSVADGTIAALRAKVRQDMERALKNAVHHYVKTQVFDCMLSANLIDVPTALLEEEIDLLKRQTAQRVSGNQTKGQEQELPRDLFETQAKRRVIIALLLSEVIKQKKLKADTTRVNALIEEIASAYDNPKVIINLYKKNKSLIRNIHNMALEEQAFEILLANAKVTEKETCFTDFMHQLSAA